jgi:transposase-like protein
LDSRSHSSRWRCSLTERITDDADPDHVAVDETVIQRHDERYWLYAAVDPDTDRLLHVRLYPRRRQALTEIFRSELREETSR